MLATAQEVQHAMNLSPAQVRQALSNSGYIVDAGWVLSARFLGFNGDSFVYEIEFPDEGAEESGILATGKVYVKLKRQAFDNSYRLFADY